MADIKISELTAATALLNVDYLEVVQGGANKKATIAQIRNTPINAQTGTSYTLVLTDAGKVVRSNNASAQTHTIPPNSSVAFAVGDTVAFRQVGAGQLTVAPGSGVTLNIPTGFQAKTGRQHGTIMIHKVDTNEWDITGDLAAG